MSEKSFTAAFSTNMCTKIEMKRSFHETQHNIIHKHPFVRFPGVQESRSTLNHSHARSQCMATELGRGSAHSLVSTAIGATGGCSQDKMHGSLEWWTFRYQNTFNN
jgi:hypothetical protein